MPEQAPGILKVPGVSKPVPEAKLNRFLASTTKHFVEVRPELRGAERPVVLDNANPDDIVELEYQDGLRHWIRADQLTEDLERSSAARGAEDPFTVPVYLPNTRTRGESSGPSLSFVKVHSIDLRPNRSEILNFLSGHAGEFDKQLSEAALKQIKEKLLEEAADPLATVAIRYILYWLESKLDPEPGLYYVSDPKQLEVARRITTENPYDRPSDAPILLFIHGTASSIAGSFGELSGSSVWGSLREKYKDRILALQHRTLSVSPIQNALDAAQLLPANARLHIVTHSRGGLVGELLGLRNLSKADFDLFARERPDDVSLLENLSSKLSEKNFTIERYVRVACPARGTLLASDRLDGYLSLLLSLIGKIPALAANPAYEVFQACLLAIVKKRARPDEVPGLEAQRPESPVIHFLNRSDLTTESDLAVISGKAKPGGLFRNFFVFASNVFYRTANDFVVNTDAMYGGLARAADRYFFLDEGGDVDHFHYFKNDLTRDQLLAWLSAEKGQAGGAFARFEFLNRNLIFPALRGAEKLPLLIFVPGLFGTHLRTQDRRIWLAADALAKGQLKELSGAEVMTEPFSYRLNGLINFLGSSYQVLPFPYDWRKTPEQVAGDLNKFVSSALEANPRRMIRFLAVSSGANVLRSMIAQDPDFWKLLCANGARVVALGSPCTVSTFARALADGSHKLVRLLQLMDRGQSGDLGALFASIPSIRTLLDGMAAQPLSEIYYVAGNIPDSEREPVKDLAIWHTPVPLGNIGEYWPAFESVRELLASGHSNRLAQRPFATVSFATPDGPTAPLLYPDAKDIADAAFEAEELPIEPPITIHLSVKHADLRNARDPVIVGHYLGDGIVSAEKTLDQALGGSLSHRFHSDIYPGAKDTFEVILQPDCSPPGALIIGLGEVGEIKTETARRGVASAVVAYALRQLESRKSGEEILSLGISSLLVGTYGGNSLTVRDSVSAVAEGVVRANQLLRARGLGNHVRIENLEFIELFLDQAIAAAHEVVAFADRRNDDPRDEAQFLATREVVTGEGGQFRRPSNPYVTGWWRRVKIEESQGVFTYTKLTDRARAELTVQATQRPLIEHYLKSYSAIPAYDPNLSLVLFDSLLPKELKDEARDGTGLVLLVDRQTAAYPWELLAYRSKDQVQPLATAIGLLRQFVVPDAAQAPRTSREMIALVIGDPATNDPKYPPLPRARAEAELVIDILEEAGYNAKPLFGPDATPLAVHAGIIGRDNRIVHIAAHGVYDECNPSNSGVVLDRGLKITAKEIAGLDPLPELVFLNCCYLGKVSDERNSQTDDAQQAQHFGPFAGTLAQQLIAEGVKAVIAAGWAIDDEAGAIFAKTFYREMILNGTRFGEAIKKARIQAFQERPGSNTFGAYQCYGNPDFALAVGGKTAQAQRPPLVARDEYIDFARNIQAIARGVIAEGVAATIQQLRQMEGELPTFAKDGEVYAAFGAAYADLGAFSFGIESYERALQDKSSRVPVWAAEQSVNLRYRYAAELTGRDRAELIELANNRLEWLLALGATRERWSIKGSGYKILARHSAGEERTGYLQKARAAYHAAYHDPLDFHFYPALNEVTLAFLLPDFDTEWALGVMGNVQEQLGEKVATGGAFWDRVGICDAKLLQFVIIGKLPDQDHQDLLIREYKRTLATAAARERQSVATQACFLRDMLDPKLHEGEIEALSRLIAALNFKPN